MAQRHALRTSAALRQLTRPLQVQWQVPNRLRVHVRHESTVRNPLRTDPTIDEQVALLASRDLYKLSLSDLVRHGRPPLTTEALLRSANFTSTLIPVRLAHRIRALRNLPFILVSNPHISRIHSIYVHSLTTLLPFLDHEITTLEEEVRFTDVLADLVQQHTNTIPFLARGFLEGRRYIEKDRVTTFLEDHLRARIGTRLIAEQHIALHLSSLPHSGVHSVDAVAAGDGKFSYIGIIDTALKPATILQQTAAFVADLCEFKYGVRPTLAINGEPDTTIAHIPSHLEYIFTELLKNAFRATVESGNERDPVEVTIALAGAAKPPNATAAATPAAPLDSSVPPGLPATSQLSDSDGELLTVRIRDHGGGIAPEHLPQVWGYSFTTFTEEDAAERTSGAAGAGTDDALNTLTSLSAGGSTIAGLGYGLPLSRAYAEHFGGGVELQSLWGWGTDAYLRLKGLRGF